MRRKLFVTLLLLLATAVSAFERQPNADYRARRQRLAAQLGNGVLVLFAPTEAEGQNATSGFRQNEDFYYLTGWREPGAALLVAPKPYTEILFLPAHNASQERWTGPKLGAESPDARKQTGFDHIDVLDHLRDELVRVLPSPQATVYSDISDSGATASTIPLAWLRRANAFPNYTSMRDVSSIVGALRLSKDGGEIAFIRKATDASVEAHKAAMRAAKPGMTENELAALMRYEFEKRGCEVPAYAPIVGSGYNSTVLHYSENSGTLAAGDLVVLDVAGEYSYYASDITRTLPVNGKFTPRQREIYDIVLGAQRAAIDAFKAGSSTIGRTSESSLYKVAYDYINTHGKDAHGQPLGQYFIHGLSHYVGLEVHDSGDTAKPLEPGAVFTIEPGIYIPEERLGVRIEDIFMVGVGGTLVELSAGLPKTAEDVENAMK
ncbi:MAG: aminopeptidase P N-terminal domain-containing protein [Acidobacteria bacterium]|nr:aminopeptidase P N-terminal domain-containing protein [Acidobacteriota bacterium]